MIIPINHNRDTNNFYTYIVDRYILLFIVLVNLITVPLILNIPDFIL